MSIASAHYSASWRSCDITPTSLLPFPVSPLSLAHAPFNLLCLLLSPFWYAKSPLPPSPLAQPILVCNVSVLLALIQGQGCDDRGGRPSHSSLYREPHLQRTGSNRGGR